MFLIRVAKIIKKAYLQIEPELILREFRKSHKQSDYISFLYPNIEEGSNSHKACEPAASGASVASTSADDISAVHDWIDDMDWDKYPIIGPSSKAEAIESIDKFEENLKYIGLLQRSLIDSFLRNFHD